MPWQSGLKGCAVTYSMTFVDREALQALVPHPLRVLQFGFLGATPTGGAFLVQATCPFEGLDLGYSMSGIFVEIPESAPDDITNAQFVLQALSGDPLTSLDFAAAGLPHANATGALQVTPVGPGYRVEGAMGEYSHSDSAAFGRGCSNSGGCHQCDAWYFQNDKGIRGMRICIETPTAFDGASTWNVPPSDPLSQFESPAGKFLHGLVVAAPIAELQHEIGISPP